MIAETSSPQNDEQTGQPSESQASDLKASDFFPPGTGWNKDDAQGSRQDAGVANQEPSDREAGRSQH